MNKIVIVFIVMYFFSCGAGISDFTEELGNGYVYESFGQELKNIRSPIAGQKNIYGKVIQYVHDENFILVMQQPNEEVYRSILAEEIISKNRNKYLNHSIDDIKEGERLADSLIANDPYYLLIFANKINYWIIYHKNRQIFGPFTEEEYDQKRKEMKITDKLQLDSPEEKGAN
ncbi:DUF3997 domain-containing protein [Dyadobacter sp. CY312]|uniref:DUF3997 domain-containing protein n=1 Tax=Dyadobacter sp. CY312 TaxID=2907303 RepID=UPI001F43228B|nr:DUF3997 domain-containing protein [Dyadobacter sp. CY312]MCE7043815.1 DUF3997 domain-containing protein [Dyadobacter sp. CY312]